MDIEKKTPGRPYDSITEPDTPEQAEAPVGDPGIEGLIEQIKETADKLARDNAGRGDVKMLATALRELRYCFNVFAKYRGKRKVTVFGSARTKPDHPAYQAAVEFGKAIAEAGYMVITGAASGIMQAGHEGAGRDQSFGVNILLPFEQSSNPIIAGDPKLVTMRYFFTRKLVFLKESDAVVLFPGGFGTHDEAFEALTLIQTGKSHIFPVVMIDHKDGRYWQRWQSFIEDDLLAEGYIGPADQSLYLVTDSVDEAVAEIDRFYRVYHSMRYVRHRLVLRLTKTLSEELMEKIREQFAGITTDGVFEQCEALPPEVNEPELAELPRLCFRFDRHQHGRLRQLIDLINREG